LGSTPQTLADSIVRGRHTTDPAHMPKAHQRHLEWTPSRLTAWARTIGPQTAALVQAILADRPHPEQGYRSCLGLLRLGKHYGEARLEAACTRAVLVRARSYRHVDSMLKHGLDRLAPPEMSAPLTLTPVHEHPSVERALTAGCVVARSCRESKPRGDHGVRRSGAGLRDHLAHRFGLLVEAEWAARENKRLGRALQEAKLKLSQACLEAIDYPARRELDKAVIRQLATCRWVAEHHNVILVGATGVGKSFIACALAHQACRKGYRAFYRRASRLFHELTLARADGTYVRLLGKLARLDVLLIDDWALAPVQDAERRDLPEILEDRYGPRSTIITSQLPPPSGTTTSPMPPWPMPSAIGSSTTPTDSCYKDLHGKRRPSSTTSGPPSVAPLRSRCADLRVQHGAIWVFTITEIRKKSFEITLSIAGRTKASVKCPGCGSSKVSPQMTIFSAKTSRKG
jgi:DNA replication protein DnaC